ncbi:MAG: hypothetical protein QNK40_07545 [Desulfobacterales bacterium]|nr:hypothetical protein [Desulfobacterales bacterium]
MKINHSLFIIMILIILSSGCSKKEIKDSLARSAYMTLQSISNDHNQEDLYETHGKQQSYDDYKQKREMMLKEKKITDEQRNLNTNLYMSLESAQEEVTLPPKTGDEVKLFLKNVEQEK